MHHPQPGIEVSVVLCSYNGEGFIEDQIRSIVSQSYPLKEIIVVDDCSTDNTLKIVKQLAKQYSVIAVHQNQFNLGFNKNFEKALQLATGEIIAVSDQDDVWHPHKIEMLLKSWNDTTLLIYCDSTIFEQNIPERPKPNRLIRKVRGKDPGKLSLYNTISGHTMMVKKELVALSLPFEKDVYYDWWMAVVASCNNGITYQPSILVYQRAHGNNLTLKPMPDKISEYKSMLLAHLKKFQTSPNLPGEHKIFFQKLYSAISDSLDNKKRWQLFLFLLRNRKVIFYYKKRIFEIISHLKSSYVFAFRRN